MVYLSDMNLRAVLVVLVSRAGGSIEITNEELYDAMIPSNGGERFAITDTVDGIQVSVQPSREERAGSN